MRRSRAPYRVPPPRPGPRRDVSDRHEVRGRSLVLTRAPLRDCVPRHVPLVAQAAYPDPHAPVDGRSARPQQSTPTRVHSRSRDWRLGRAGPAAPYRARHLRRSSRDSRSIVASAIASRSPASFTSVLWRTDVSSFPCVSSANDEPVCRQKLPCPPRPRVEAIHRHSAPTTRVPGSACPTRQSAQPYDPDCSGPDEHQRSAWSD